MEFAWDTFNRTADNAANFLRSEKNILKLSTLKVCIQNFFPTFENQGKHAIACFIYNLLTHFN